MIAENGCSDHDIGFRAGVVSAANEAIRIVCARIDRLEPGKQQKLREELLMLEAAIHSAFVRAGYLEHR